MKLPAVTFWVSLCLLCISGLLQAQPSKIYTSLEEAKQHPELVYKLDLHKSKLTELPEEIMQFTNLTYLDLSKNKLSELPAWIQEH